MWKISATSLSLDNKINPTNTFSILVHKSKGQGFWKSILTSDETWISYDNAKQKHQWASAHQTPTTTPHGKKKLMLCLWWNYRGLVHYKCLKAGKTVTADLYEQQLDRVNQVLLESKYDTSKIRFLQDNAKPHTAKITLKKIDVMNWKLLPHAPYSPD